MIPKKKLLSYHTQLKLFLVQEKSIDPVKQKEIESLIINDEWDKNVTPKEFKSSMSSSSRREFLVDYSIEDLQKMKLFKLKDYNIGYALKRRFDYSTNQYLSENYDEITSLHNNETNVSNLGKLLMESAVRNGGIYLDHFDGHLSKFYSDLGFEEYKRHGLDLNWEGDRVVRDKYGDIDIVYRSYIPKDKKVSEHSKRVIRSIIQVR